MAALLAELRQTIRSLARDRRFTIFALINLALGLGATIAVYNAVRTALLDPLTYPESERLVAIWSRWGERDIERIATSGGDFRAIQREARSLEGLAAVGSLIQNLTGGRRPEQVTVGWVSENFFDVIGMRPALGRGFAAGEPVSSLILGHGVWQSAFDSDTSIIGESVSLDGIPFTVVGVLPAGFRLHLAANAGIATEIQVWRPPDPDANPARWRVDDVQSSMLRLVGRLRDGVSLPQAQQELDDIAAERRRQFPDHAAVGHELVASSLRGEVVAHFRAPLVVLQLAALAVLLLACANVANLSLSRGQRRGRDLDIRSALGATRARLFWQLMVENGVLGVASAVLAWLVASGFVRFLRQSNLPGIPRLQEIALGPSDLGWIAALATASTLAFGVWPALRVSREGGAANLRARGMALRVRSTLVSAEVALAVLLAICAVLVLRSYRELTEKDPGFDVEDLLTFGINLPGVRYEAPGGTARFLALLETRLEEEPWAVRAGSTWPLPLEGQLWAGTYRTAATPDPQNLPMADYRLASPGLLEALDLRLVEGRNLGPADSTAVLVDRTLARSNWPNASAIGQRVQLGGEGPQLTVLGVVEDVEHPTVRTYARETIYLPMVAHSWTDWEIFLVIRTRDDPADWADEARGVLRSLDPELGVGKMAPMRWYRRLRLAPSAFAGAAVGFFALAAFLLALGGVYGIVSYTAAQRRREMAIRMAVGASDVAILGLMLRRTLSMVGVGAVVGTVTAGFARNLLGGLLYGIAPLDPMSFGAPVAGVLIAGLVATWVPTRRMLQNVAAALVDG